MATTPHSIRRFGMSAPLALTILLSVLLSGCIVQSNGNTGVLEINWSSSSCEAGDRIRITASRNGVLETQVNRIFCDRRTQSLFVPPGNYDVTVDLVDSNGAIQGSVTVANLSVFMDQTTATTPITFGGGGGGGANAGSEVQVHWTIAGEAAQTGCAKVGLKTVTVSLRDATTDTVLFTAQTTCADGAVNLTGVAPGSYRLQLDAATDGGVLTWGNAQLGVPFNVAANTTVIIKQPIELVDLRAIVSLNWQFSDSKTCNQKNVDWVLVEIRDGANKIIVPMSDKSATKPCDIGPNSAYNLRVIDLQFATPTCTIPADAKGLVICGVTGKSLTISVSTIDATDKVIAFGGQMTIDNLPAARHTKIPAPLYLSACNNSSNICAAP